MDERKKEGDESLKGQPDSVTTMETRLEMLKLKGRRDERRWH